MSPRSWVRRQRWTKQVVAYLWAMAEDDDLVDEVAEEGRRDSTVGMGTSQKRLVMWGRTP